MIQVYKNLSQIISVNTGGLNLKYGREMGDIGIYNDSCIICENGFIRDIIPNESFGSIAVSLTNYEIHDFSNKILLPGLVECHTHLVFSGERRDDFRKRLNRVSYEEIAKEGGGINTTRDAVKQSSTQELVEIARKRVDSFIKQGVTTLEIKSGYGLDFNNEIKILRAIKFLDISSGIDIVSTFLGAHTIPTEHKNDREKYILTIINEMLPFIAENNLASFCDAFCEPTAFRADEIDSIFQSALENGLKIKIHAEQFSNSGGLEIALKHNAVSLDHLEVMTQYQIDQVAKSNSVSVLLPGVSYFLKHKYAPARQLIDSGAIVALASDYNPGSSHIDNISMLWSLALFNLEMTPEEIISAYTINAAKALGVENYTGSLEIGKYADFSIYDTDNYIDLFYNPGKNLNIATIKKGEEIQ